MTQISKNILLVSGSGRNVGKTSFIQQIIRQNAEQKLVAVKITPHFHEPTSSLTPVLIKENYRIFLETDLSSGKDSSLFLQSGAEKVFYLQATDDYLDEAFRKIREFNDHDQPIIVESAALRKFIIPEFYIFIQKENEELKPSALQMKKLANMNVTSDGFSFSYNPSKFIFDRTWKIVHDDNT